MSQSGTSSLNVSAMLQARHGSTGGDLDITADVSYPRTEISELMQSPCRPEENGYFGSTSGSPSKLFYDFEIEARQGADISQAVTVVQEHLMDIVLSVTFPSICSFDGEDQPPATQSRDLSINGFRFGREQLDLTRTCTPSKSRSNKCNKVAGQIYVFGGSSEETLPYTQSVINYAISGATTSVMSLGVERVEPVTIQSTDPNTDAQESKKFPFPSIAIYGLVICFLCVVLGIVLLVLYVKKQRAFQRNQRKLDKRTMTDSTVSLKHENDADGTQFEGSESASLTSRMSSDYIDFERGSLSNVTSEMIDEKFDDEYESDDSEEKEPSQGSSQSSEDVMSHPPHYLDEHGRYLD